MSLSTELGLDALDEHLTPLLDELFLVDLRFLSAEEAKMLSAALGRAKAMLEAEGAAAKAELESAGVVEMMRRVHALRPEAYPPDFTDLRRLYREVRRGGPPRCSSSDPGGRPT